jgi:hypothetical protein
MNSSNSILLGQLEWAMVSIMFLNQELSWLVLVIREWDNLSKLGWLTLLVEVNWVSINNYVLSKILIGIESSGMRWGWLINRPVVEWWVNYWIVGFSLD